MTRSITTAGILLAVAWWSTFPAAAQDSGSPTVFTGAAASLSTTCAPAYDPDTDPPLVEMQVLWLCLQIEDLDWAPDPNATGTADVPGFAVSVASYWIPYVHNGIMYGPEPPSVPTDADGDNAGGYYIFPGPASGATSVTVRIPFLVPEFNGRNQARLEGLINYDVEWMVIVGVHKANGTAPEGDEAWDRIGFSVLAIENTALAPANPPAFADAGTPRTVTAGQAVILDASRSFDSTNLGFDSQSGRVLDGDRLIYSWEWVDGPVRVDPVPDPDGNPSRALVLLNVPSAADRPYVYRVLVTDGVNTVPSSAAVVIHVRTVLPNNQAPQAAAIGPAAAVPIGAVIQLNASGSSDPDGDQLTYRWRQVNAIGRDLDPAEAQKAFQPISGSETAISTWRATNNGTFYFRLLVQDQPELRDPVLAGAGLGDTVFLSVQVSGQAAGASAVATAADQTAGGTSAAEGTLNSVVPTGLCGAGLMPLALVPLVLLFMRGRIR